MVVLLQELLRVVVRIDINLCQGVVDRLLLVAGSEGRLKEGEEELETVAGFDLLHELVDGDRRRVDGREKVLDDTLIAINIQQATNNTGCPGRVDLLHVDLNRLELLVLVEV